MSQDFLFAGHGTNQHFSINTRAGAVSITMGLDFRGSDPRTLAQAVSVSRLYFGTQISTMRPTLIQKQRVFIRDLTRVPLPI